MKNLFNATAIARNIILTIATVTASTTASAAPVLIDFENLPYSSPIENFVTKGFVFSPGCHYDLSSYGASSVWIGFDISGCLGGDSEWRNKNYLGPSSIDYHGALYVASSSGAIFDLKSLSYTIADNDVGGFNVFSSKGGSTIAGDERVNKDYSFDGPEWIGLEWLVFQYSGGEPSGFDNLVLDIRSVDEPSPIALLSLSSLVLLGLRSRKNLS